MTPKYSSPPEIVGCKISDRSKSFNFGKTNGVNKITAIIEE